MVTGKNKNQESKIKNEKLKKVPLVNPRRTAEILGLYQFRPSKKLGQSFLVDANILRKILQAANPQEEDVILEIGPGIGTVTEALASRVRLVVAVEYDRRLLPILDNTLKAFSNVRLANVDALKANLRELFPSMPRCNKMVSNLPYQIAAPLLVRILSEYPEITRSVVMLQREVADRILATKGNKNFGAFTLKVQYYARVEMVARVSRKVFLPEPNVDSAVVKLERRLSPRVKVLDEQLLFAVINAAFEHRRKMIRNALEGATFLRLSKEKVEEGLRMSGIDPRKRGEALYLEDYGRLTDAFVHLSKVP